MKRKAVKGLAAAVLTGIAMGMPVMAAPVTLDDGTVFDPEYYAAANPDVVQAWGADAQVLYLHYQMFGKEEGRLAYADVTGFDAAYYAQQNPDVVAALGSDPATLYQHYVLLGRAEGRDAKVATTTTEQPTTTEQTTTTATSWKQAYLSYLQGILYYEDNSLYPEDSCLWLGPGMVLFPGAKAAAVNMDGDAIPEIIIINTDDSPGTVWNGFEMTYHEDSGVKRFYLYDSVENFRYIPYSGDMAKAMEGYDSAPNFVSSPEFVSNPTFVSWREADVPGAVHVTDWVSFSDLINYLEQ